MTTSSSLNFILTGFVLVACLAIPFVAAAGGGDGGDGGAASDLGFAADDGFYGNNTQGTVGTSDAEAGQGGTGIGSIGSFSSQSSKSPTIGVTLTKEDIPTNYTVEPPDETYGLSKVTDENGKAVGYYSTTNDTYSPIGTTGQTAASAETDDDASIGIGYGLFGHDSDPTVGVDSSRFGDNSDDSYGLDTGGSYTGGGDTDGATGGSDDSSSGGDTGGSSDDGNAGGGTSGGSAGGSTGGGSSSGGGTGGSSGGSTGGNSGSNSGGSTGGSTGGGSTGGSSDGNSGGSSGGPGYGVDGNSNPDNWWGNVVNTAANGFNNAVGFFTGDNNNGTGNQGVACTMDARMCGDGSYVGRTGPNCEFAACPNEAAATPTPAKSESSKSTKKTSSAVLGAISTINPSAALLVQFFASGGTDMISGQTSLDSNYVNLSNVAKSTSRGTGSNSTTRSTSTLDNILDRVFGRDETTTTTTTITRPTSTQTTSGNSNANTTNTISFEAKVLGSNGNILTNWQAPISTISIPEGAKLYLRWTASDYTQCLTFFNDNGRYALQVDNRNMLTGNTETEGYNVPEVSELYRLECGGQKNGEMGVDQKIIRVEAAASSAAEATTPIYGTTPWIDQSADYRP